MGITVRDIERSYAFYTRVAGMSVWDQERALDVEAPEERRSGCGAEGMDFMVFSSDSFDVLTANPGAEFKYVMLQSADQHFILQLTEYVTGGGDWVDPGHNRPGSPHLSFFVTDVDAKWAALQSSGDATPTSKVVQITPSMRSFYVNDPDGVPVEFIEVQRRERP
jgi:catechol 2,3-dioxygenase-like lactoylglutathione lyase family enzyme